MLSRMMRACMYLWVAPKCFLALRDTGHPWRLHSSCLVANGYHVALDGYREGFLVAIWPVLVSQGIPPVMGAHLLESGAVRHTPAAPQSDRSLVTVHRQDSAVAKGVYSSRPCPSAGRQCIVVAS